MKKAIPVIIALSLILLIVLGACGYHVIQKYMPTKEQADLASVYGVTGNETVIYYDYERVADVQGLYENGQTYLPLSWVNQMLNKRFYWDATEELLVYTLPDQIVYADAQTLGSNGAPLLLVKDGEVYLTLGLIANYTDIEIKAFDAEETKRVFLTQWGDREITDIRKDAYVRVKGGIKSPVLTKLSASSEVIVLDVLENWSKVVTEDGHIGYMENKVLGEPRTEYAASGRDPVVYSSNLLDEKIVLGWHQMASQKGPEDLIEALKGTKGVNVISPTWFSLTDNQGNFISLANKAYVDEAHKRGIQVWALLDNFSSKVQTEVLLASTTTRRNLIDKLIAEVERYGIDGINMDFESLKPEAGVHYIQFLRELSIPCREKGIILSVDNYVPTSYNRFYDVEEQGIVADYVIIMGYDEHYSSSDPGSVASFDFVQSGIANTLDMVPKEKVINGVPFYTRIWTETGTSLKEEEYGISAAKNWISKNNVELYWQAELGQFYGEVKRSSGFSYVWMEEENSLKLKMDLIKAYDLAGVACWKLGLEPASVWDVIGWK